MTINLCQYILLASYFPYNFNKLNITKHFNSQMKHIINFCYFLVQLKKLITLVKSAIITNPKVTAKKHAPSTPIVCEDERSSSAQMSLRTVLERVDFSTVRLFFISFISSFSSAVRLMLRFGWYILEQWQGQLLPGGDSVVVLGGFSIILIV